MLTTSATAGATLGDDFLCEQRTYTAEDLAAAQAGWESKGAWGICLSHWRQAPGDDAWSPEGIGHLAMRALGGFEPSHRVGVFEVRGTQAQVLALREVPELVLLARWDRPPDETLQREQLAWLLLRLRLFGIEPFLLKDSLGLDAPRTRQEIIDLFLVLSRQPFGDDD
jgi:hypothetical protein